MTGRRYTLQTAEEFGQLYEKMHLNVFRFIYGLHGGPVEDVEDLTAEVFERAWKARGKFDGDEGAALGWLFQISRNLVIDKYRRRKVRGEQLSLEEARILSPDLPVEEVSARREELTRLWNALQKLPDRQRELVVLRYILDLPVKTIAKQTGIAENTISVTLKRLLGKLRSGCKDQEQG